MFYLAIVSLIWGFSFGLVGNVLSGVNPFLVATMRLACASLVFLPFLRLRFIGFNQSFYLIRCGFIQFGLMYVFYMKAFEYLPSHLVALFSVMTPFYVVLINDIRRRKISARYFLVALLSVIGAGVINMQNFPSEGIWFGFFLMQMAGICFAFGQISYKDWKKLYPQVKDISVFGLLTLGGTVSAGLFTLIFIDSSMLSITRTQMQAILYLGIVASGLGFFLWNKGATKTEAGTLAAFNNAVVPIAVFISLFVFGEISNVVIDDIMKLLTGSILILIAVIVSLSKKNESEKIDCKRI